MAGGGIGEAMLLGAAMGGGSAAITGGDPLKGALLGGLTGGIGGGISGVANAGTAAATLPAVAPATSNAVTNAVAGVADDAIMAGTNLGTNVLGVGNMSGVNPAFMSNTASSVAPSGGAALGMGQPSGVNAALMPGPVRDVPLNTAAVQPSSGGIGDIFKKAMRPAQGDDQYGLFKDPMKYMKNHKFLTGATALTGALGGRRKQEEPEDYSGPLSRYRLSDNYVPAFAEGGVASLAANGYDRMVGEEPMYQTMARGGITDLGSYSDGGRMLQGPGDGMSDSIPANIAGKRPARLADGEFVIPADVVSHLGNGSTDAGAKQLYAMMDRVRKARTGRKTQGREISARKYAAA